MIKTVRNIGLVAHDGMKKDLIEWVKWNAELLIGHKFYCTGTTGSLVSKALKKEYADINWDITILKSGPLGGDQQMGSLIVENKIDYLFFFIDPMTMQPHDTDIKALTRLASVQNIVLCCNRSTADHTISSPLFSDPDYHQTQTDYSMYNNRLKSKLLLEKTAEKSSKNNFHKEYHPI